MVGKVRPIVPSRELRPQPSGSQPLGLHYAWWLLPALLLLLATLILVAWPDLVIAGPSPQQATVDPQVWETLQAEGQADVLLLFRSQADLAVADALPTKEARGRYVHQTLTALAQASQGQVRQLLDG